MPCSDYQGYGYWDSYRESWNTNPTVGLKARLLRLQFDGGMAHKDGSRFALASLTPPMTVFQILVSTAGLKPADGDPVKIDLGCVAFEKDCLGKPKCENYTHFLDGLDVSSEQCNHQVSCGPWTCYDSCKPECCPELPSVDCCPDEDDPQLDCGKSDLVLTLHGTPAACSELIVTFYYQ